MTCGYNQAMIKAKRYHKFPQRRPCRLDPVVLDAGRRTNLDFDIFRRWWCMCAFRTVQWCKIKIMLIWPASTTLLRTDAVDYYDPGPTKQERVANKECQGSQSRAKQAAIKFNVSATSWWEHFNMLPHPMHPVWRTCPPNKSDRGSQRGFCVLVPCLSPSSCFLKFPIDDWRRSPAQHRLSKYYASYVHTSEYDSCNRIHTQTSRRSSLASSKKVSVLLRVSSLAATGSLCLLVGWFCPGATRDSQLRECPNPCWWIWHHIIDRNLNQHITVAENGTSRLFFWLLFSFPFLPFLSSWLNGEPQGVNEVRFTIGCTRWLPTIIVPR